MGRYRVALMGMRIEADAQATRYKDLVYPAGTGLEIPFGIFRINAAFHRHTLDADVLLFNRKRFTGCDLDLCSNQIDTRYHFANGVFYLDASVDFDEIEIVLLIDDEFNSSRIGVLSFTTKSHRSVTHRQAGFFWEIGSWAFFN